VILRLITDTFALRDRCEEAFFCDSKLSQITMANIYAMRSRAHLGLSGGDYMAMAFSDLRVAMSLHATWLFGFECHAIPMQLVGCS
jgi:hypothetical protein